MRYEDVLAGLKALGAGHDDCPLGADAESAR